jgi:hypothetical protein
MKSLQPRGKLIRKSLMNYKENRMNLILVSFYFGDWPLSISVCMYTTVEGISSPAIGVLLKITIQTKEYLAIHSLLDVHSCFLVFFQLDRVISIGVDLLPKYTI